jgi:hypothetical protein
MISKRDTPLSITIPSCTVNEHEMKYDETE